MKLKTKKICCLFVLFIFFSLFYLFFSVYLHFRYGIETTLFRDVSFVFTVFGLLVSAVFNLLMGVYDKEVENEGK